MKAKTHHLVFTVYYTLHPSLHPYYPLLPHFTLTSPSPQSCETCASLRWPTYNTHARRTAGEEPAPCSVYSGMSYPSWSRTGRPLPLLPAAPHNPGIPLWVAIHIPASESLLLSLTTSYCGFLYIARCTWIFPMYYLILINEVFVIYQCISCRFSYPFNLKQWNNQL